MFSFLKRNSRKTFTSFLIPFRLYKGVLVHVSVFFLFKAKNGALTSLGQVFLTKKKGKTVAKYTSLYSLNGIQPVSSLWKDKTPEEIRSNHSSVYSLDIAQLSFIEVFKSINSRYINSILHHFTGYGFHLSSHNRIRAIDFETIDSANGKGKDSFGKRIHSPIH